MAGAILWMILYSTPRDTIGSCDLFKISWQHIMFKPFCLILYTRLLAKCDVFRAASDVENLRNDGVQRNDISMIQIRTFLMEWTILVSLTRSNLVNKPRHDRDGRTAAIGGRLHRRSALFLISSRQNRRQNRR